MVLRKIIILITLGLIGCSSVSRKAELEKPLPQKVNVEGQELILVGTGLRVASKFGITAKIYKAGLYAESKPKISDDLFKSHSGKQIFMRFVYRISRSLLREGWEEAYNYSCYLNCSSTTLALQSFLDLIQTMKVGQTMSIDYLPEKIVVTIDNQKQGEVLSADFSKNLLAVFIGEKVIDKDLKNGLLSL